MGVMVTVGSAVVPNHTGCNSQTRRDPCSGRLYRDIPVLSAHPGRSMDDSNKQVSWLVAEVLASPSRRAQFLGRRQWFFDARRTTYSCGGSPGITPEFPFNPRTGNLSRGARMRFGPTIVKCPDEIPASGDREFDFLLSPPAPARLQPVIQRPGARSIDRQHQQDVAPQIVLADGRRKAFLEQHMSI
jgi:hypothetical protein